MGATLQEIYQVVTNKAGFKGRMRLAVRTGISRIKAVQIEDSSETVNKFITAGNEIIGEDIAQFLKGGENV